MMNEKSQNTKSVFAAIVVALTISVAGSIIGITIGRDHTDVSSSAQFNQAMMYHHSQAVTMAMTIVQRGENADLVTVARDIVLTQQTQIGAMGAHLDIIGASRVGDGHRMPGMATSQEVAALQTLPVGDAQREMVRLMILHHIGGVEMAEQALMKDLNAETRRLALAIANSQKSELELLQQLQTILR
jgi:uncharacterized protein (DUF305 family)